MWPPSSKGGSYKCSYLRQEVDGTQNKTLHALASVATKQNITLHALASVATKQNETLHALASVATVVAQACSTT
jgi:uncharacterized FlgJ-related protein